MPAKTPTRTAEVGVMKPQAGVTTTKPATMPEQNPRTLGLPRVIHSIIGQTKPAVAAAKVVVVKALAAMASAPSAEPALKPYQPTQSMPVPTMHKVIECGVIGSRPSPLRLPRMMQSTKALHPEVMWTTVPPAKSSALMAASLLSGPHIKPVVDQTMWANGKYTANIQMVTNRSTAMNFMRSAMAPMIKAGVMMAKVSWNIAHMESLIQ